MNPRPLYARLAAEVLAEESRDDVSVVSPGERARAIDVVSEAIAQRDKRRRRTRGAFVVLSLAASAVLVFGAVRVLSHRAPSGEGALSAKAPALAPSVEPIATPLVGDVRVRSGDVVRAIAQGTPLSAGDHVLADGAARASVTLVTGTRLALEGTSDLAMTQSHPAMTVFTLVQGAVRADVAKLKAGERFLVRTADAEVEVRGTSFRVAVVAADTSCPVPVATRVEVTEGVVAVRHGATEVSLHPGESWPPPCTPPPPRASAPPAAAQVPKKVAPARLPRPAHENPAPAEREQASSDLAAQNDMFARAMQEKQSGRAGAAVATLDRFAATYPASPLAENAVAERMKILATSDPARARTAARDYLTRYPRGFARVDAEKILATSP
ncbi:FecR domain-containing protein [Pendulispora rubella]|uniref:FecR domain-containing protein n=1 Tax=Pendulispora rubella TaxID=2741070 RepID=A0ABZ2L9Z6_9BACT